MISIWPTAARLSCFHPRTCWKLEKLAQPTRSAFSSSCWGTVAKSVQFQTGIERSGQIARMLPRKVVVRERGYATKGKGTVKQQPKRSILKNNNSVPKKSPILNLASSEKIVTRYENLPYDFDEEVGLSFRKTPLSNIETFAIFGKGIDAPSATKLLQVLQGRRVAGTLDDPALPIYLSKQPQRLQNLGLAWLRENVPVDEIQNAGRRAEFELTHLEEAPPKAIRGESGLDIIRQENRAEAAAAKAAREKQMEEIRENTGPLALNGQGTAALQERKPSAFVEKYAALARLSEDTSPPEMSHTKRLLPSTIFTLFVLGIALVFPLVYIPPTISERLYPEIPPAAATMLAIIGANLAVWMLWRFPPFWRYGNKFFVLVGGQPVAFSVLGNVFSHQTLAHLATNMVVLYLIGSRLHDEVGRANFLSLYFATGVLGSLFSLWSFVLRGVLVSCSYGASGAVAGVVGSYLWLNKDDQFGIFLVPKESFSFPGWAPLCFIIGVELLGIRRMGSGGIGKVDHWAHLGGYLSGCLGAEVLKVRRRARERRKEGLKQQVSA